MKGVASAKASRQNHACKVRGAAKRPSWRKQVRGIIKEAEAKEMRETHRWSEQVTEAEDQRPHMSL